MTTTKSEKLEIKRIAKKYNIDFEEVSSIIESQYKFIREKIKGLDLKKDMTEEEFNKVAKNFNIPSIGKLYASYYIYKRLNKL